MLSNLRNEIKDEIANLSSVGSVYLTEPESFTGTSAVFPAVVVDLTDTDNEYESTERRKLTYSFEVRIYYQTESSKTRDEIDEALMGVYDEILDLFLDPDLLDNAFDLVPTPSNWFVAESEESTYRVATFFVDTVVHVSKT